MEIEIPGAGGNPSHCFVVPSPRLFAVDRHSDPTGSPTRSPRVNVLVPLARRTRQVQVAGTHSPRPLHRPLIQGLDTHAIRLLASHTRLRPSWITSCKHHRLVIISSFRLPFPNRSLTLISRDQSRAIIRGLLKRNPQSCCRSRSFRTSSCSRSMGTRPLGQGTRSRPRLLLGRILGTLSQLLLDIPRVPLLPGHLHP